MVAATHVEASPSLMLVFSPFLLSAVNFFFIFALLPAAFSVFFQSALMVHYYCKEKRYEPFAIIFLRRKWCNIDKFSMSNNFTEGASSKYSSSNWCISD